MAATNTISVRPDFAPPGSVSESTRDFGANDPPVGIDPVGPVSDAAVYTGDIRSSGEGVPESPPRWSGSGPGKWGH